MSGNHHAVVKPTQYKLSGQSQKALFGAMGVGLIGVILAYVMGHEARLFNALLISGYYFFCIALFGGFFVAINYLSNAGWSVSIRRIPEAFISFFPIIVVVLILVGVLGAHHLFEWTHVEFVKSDEVLSKKSGYLNLTFFIVRLVVGALVLGGLTRCLLKNSLKQDTTGDVNLTAKNAKFSAIFLVCFALMFSMFSYDLVMSLDPHWYSTMFPVYCFAGLFYSGLAMTALFVIGFMRRGFLGSYVSVEHIHDIAKFMFAFTVFYGYIAFSQFMLIWYANLPEETAYYILRSKNGWIFMAVTLVVLKFLIPFVTLLPQRVKRCPKVVEKVAMLMIFAQFVELCWMVLPANHANHHAILPIPEFLVFVGFLGLFVFCVLRFLSRNPVVPVGDPRLHEAIHHHQ